MGWMDADADGVPILTEHHVNNAAWFLIVLPLLYVILRIVDLIVWLRWDWSPWDRDHLILVLMLIQWSMEFVVFVCLTFVLVEEWK